MIHTMFGRSLSDESEEPVTIDLSSMIDCIFILLIFFIVSTVFVEETGVTVNKPDVSGASALEKNSILLAVTAEDKVFYGGESIGVQGIIGKIKPLHRRDPRHARHHPGRQGFHPRHRPAGPRPGPARRRDEGPHLGIHQVIVHSEFQISASTTNVPPRLPSPEKQVHRHHLGALADCWPPSAVFVAIPLTQKLTAILDGSSAPPPEVTIEPPEDQSFDMDEPPEEPNPSPNPRRWSRNPPISISASTSAI